MCPQPKLRTSPFSLPSSSSTAWSGRSRNARNLASSRIVPVIARRTDAHLASAAVKRSRPLAKDRASGGRAIPPRQALRRSPLRLSCKTRSTDRQWPQDCPRGDGAADAATRCARGIPGGEIVLAIGPEGGWAEDELELFRQTGWASASLGSTILRAETAAIAATAITMSELGGLIDLSIHSQEKISHE